MTYGKPLVTAIAACLLAGCASMTPRQKATVTAIGAVLVVGAVQAHSGNPNELTKIPTQPGRASAH